MRSSPSGQVGGARGRSSPSDSGWTVSRRRGHRQCEGPWRGAGPERATGAVGVTAVPGGPAGTPRHAHPVQSVLAANTGPERELTVPAASSCDLLLPGLLCLRSFFFNQSSFFGQRA